MGVNPANSATHQAMTLDKLQNFVVTTRERARQILKQE